MLSSSVCVCVPRARKRRCYFDRSRGKLCVHIISFVRVFNNTSQIDNLISIVALVAVVLCLVR